MNRLTICADFEQIIVDLVKHHLQDFKNTGIDKLYKSIMDQMRDIGIKYGRNKFRELMRRVHLRPRKKSLFGNRYVIDEESNDGNKNLIENMEINAPNQVWQIDITVIKYNGLNLNLTCMIDSYSRKVLASVLSDASHSEETSLRCLESALCFGTPKIIHSDRGPQFWNMEWRKALKSKDIAVSYSRAGCPYENGKIERLFGTLKNELGMRKLRCRSYVEYLAGVQNIIYKYNFKRLHQALNYATPQSKYVNSQ